MDPEELPGILIQCEDLQALKELVLKLYDKDILKEESYILKNVPENILDILNDHSYFETVDICGIKTVKGKVKSLEINTEDLL